MKVSEIAGKVLGALRSTKPAAVAGGPLETPLSSLAALSLVPYACDPSVQWAVIARAPQGAKLDAKPLRGVKGFGLEDAKGALLVSIPGDGLHPAFCLLQPLAKALQSLPAGAELELCAANLGVVRRDREVKADTALTAGNQRFSGKVVAGGRWAIAETSPAVSADDLRAAIEIGESAMGQSPWAAKTPKDAVQVARMALMSLALNISAPYFRKYVRVKGKQVLLGKELESRHAGLGMIFVRQRFADGPWDVRTFQALDEENQKKLVTYQLEHPFPPPPKPVVVNDKAVQKFYDEIMAEVAPK